MFFLRYFGQQLNLEGSCHSWQMHWKSAAGLWQWRGYSPTEQCKLSLPGEPGGAVVGGEVRTEKSGETEQEQQQRHHHTLMSFHKG